MARVNEDTFQSDTSAVSASREVKQDPFAQLVELARSAPSRSRFMGETLRCVAGFFQSPYAVVHVRYSSEVVQDGCHFGPTDPNFWKSSLEQFLTESLIEGRSRARLLRSKQGATRVAFLSSPIYGASGQAMGAMAMVVPEVAESELTTRLATLDSLCRLASFSAEFIGRGGNDATSSSLPNRGMLRAACGSSAIELAFAITNELRNKLDCEQVAIGWVTGNHVRILSVSGFDQITRQSPGIVALRAAMEECLDAEGVIVQQRSSAWSDESDGPAYRLHQRWHVVAAGASVASIPLRIENDVVAVVSLRHRADQPFVQEVLEDVRARTEPLMPAVRLALLAQRSLAAHVRDSIRAMVGSLVSPGHLNRKIATAMLAVGALWFCFGTMSYDITVPCIVTPAEMRHVSAPVDGVLVEAFVVAGDRTNKGDLLCRFDDRELRQQREQLRAELAVYEHKRNQAMAADSRVEARLAEANRHLIQTRLDIVERRIAMTEVRAPFDGVVVSGDLRRHVGSVLKQGEPLYAVAPYSAWLIEMELPEYATADVTASLRGSFASYARPEEVYPLTMTRVIPNITVRDRRNVFVAEANLEGGGDSLRPGMEGVAGIHVGRRSVWWVVLHRVIDYFRLKLWL